MTNFWYVFNMLLVLLSTLGAVAQSRNWLRARRERRSLLFLGQNSFLGDVAWATYWQQAGLLLTQCCMLATLSLITFAPVEAWRTLAIRILFLVIVIVKPVTSALVDRQLTITKRAYNRKREEDLLKSGGRLRRKED